MVKTLRTEHLWTFTVPWRVGDAGQEGIWGLVDKRSRCLTGENFDQTKVSHSRLQCCRTQSKGVRNLESGNFFSWNRKSCALEFGIQIQKSGSHYRLESRIQVPLIKNPADPLPGIRNPWLEIQNPRLSWIPSHGTNCHWLRLGPLKMCKQLHHVTGGHQLHWGTHMNWSIFCTCTQPNN